MKIPEPHFVLHNPSDGKALIMMIVRANNRRITISTGIKVKVNSWNKQTQRVEKGKGEGNYSIINYDLQKLTGIVMDSFVKLKGEGKLTIQLLRKDIVEKYRFSVNGESNTLTGYLAHFIQQIKTGARLTPSGRRYSNSTIEAYEVAKLHLDRFVAETMINDSLELIDLRFYTKFIDWFKDNGKTMNTIAGHISRIKVLLNAALEDGKQVCLDFKNKKFRTCWEEVDHVYLSEQEIDAIAKVHLRLESYRNVRDLFIIACYTGLRFSDLSKIDLSNIDKTKEGVFLRVKTKKTGALVVIPIKPMVYDIIKKYNGLPAVFTNKKTNSILKQVVKLAGVNVMININRTGGINSGKPQPKYKMVSLHTARRSFATNLFLAKVPAHSIMKVTGHTTEKAFLKYLKISEEDNANILVGNEFFK